MIKNYKKIILLTFILFSTCLYGTTINWDINKLQDAERNYLNNSIVYCFVVDDTSHRDNIVSSINDGSFNEYGNLNNYTLTTGRGNANNSFYLDTYNRQVSIFLLIFNGSTFEESTQFLYTSILTRNNYNNILYFNYGNYNHECWIDIIPEPNTYLLILLGIICLLIKRNFKKNNSLQID